MKLLLTLFLLLQISISSAVSETTSTRSIFKLEVKAPMLKTYQLVYEAVENQRFWVVSEPNIGGNLEGMAERLGDKYNQNKLEEIRSLVICNAFYANSVSNLDPDILALCPLRIGIIHKNGVTTVLFARPSLHAQGSRALTVIKEIEDVIIKAIESVKQQAEL